MLLFNKFFLICLLTISLLTSSLWSQTLPQSEYINHGLKWITKITVQIKNGDVSGVYKESGYEGEYELTSNFQGKVIYYHPNPFKIKTIITFKKEPSFIANFSSNKRKHIWTFLGEGEEARLLIPKEDYIMELQDINLND